MKQTIPTWRALVILDGVFVHPSIDDVRVEFVRLPKKATKNHAGALRNYGLSQVETEWAAFLDDDDSVTATYVARLATESQREPSADCIIFRMYRGWAQPTHILPQPNTDTFKIDEVGISFAMRRHLYWQGFSFIPGSREDFVLLAQLRAAHKKIVLSQYLTYYVSGAPSFEIQDDTYTRAVIH
jgi:hypothetical protein